MANGVKKSERWGERVFVDFYARDLIRESSSVHGPSKAKSNVRS